MKHLPVDPEYVTDSFMVLLKGLKQLFDRACHNAIKHHYIWLKYMLQPASRHLKSVITRCIMSNEEQEEYFRSVAEKQNKLMLSSTESSRKLQASITELYVWQSILRFNDTVPPSHFQSLGSVPVINRRVTLTVGVDQVYALTTVSDGMHGEHPPPPPSAPFPLPFTETFEEYPLSAEPYLLAPQQGSYDVVDVGGDHRKVMRQMVLQPPVVWCAETLYFNSSLNLLGRFNWTDVDISVDVKIGSVNGSNGVYIDNGGCSTYAAKEGASVIISGRESSAILSEWNKIALSVRGTVATGTCNGELLFNVTIPATPANGLVGVGTDVYGYTDFDNIQLTHAEGPSPTVYSGGSDRKKPLYFEIEKP